MAAIGRNTEASVTRRVAMRTLVAGTGALLLGPAGVAQAEEASTGDHRVSWDDGWDYPLVGTDESGHWVVEFDDGEYLVDPSGWIFDDATWYPISSIGTEGIWYIGNDGFEYLLEEFGSPIEFIV
jgi:hypothetical protein